MTVTNKQLLISESHDDLNQCTSCMEKPDQYVTHFSRLIMALDQMYLTQFTYSNLSQSRQEQWIE
jgi:hypothetical protein